ncbi:hypothetical protein OLL83_000389 [Shewanella algae]|uniref:CFI-box-CTERM domain-containing protein n=1 Tax=Shewanella algae TaxID=38313 RepID=UPI00223012E0|nr:CFI-box-CTERM domain-containing protein [Shewanella algae]UZD58906.1 hypothetical protein OLL83_000389 [Shewanella algae]
MSNVNVVCPKCEKQEVHSYVGVEVNSVRCRKCSTQFTYLFAKIRAKRSRGNRKENNREFDIRVYLNDGSEKFFQFQKTGWDDIELRANDLVVFVFLNDNIRIVQNIGIGSYTMISKPTCYIASHLYGESSDEVLFLRGWRDSKLISSRIGAFFVKIYYATSPWFIEKFGESILFNKLTRAVVNVWLRVLGYKK